MSQATPFDPKQRGRQARVDPHSIPLDEIVSLGVKKRVERSRLGYLIDLLSLTR